MKFIKINFAGIFLVILINGLCNCQSDEKYYKIIKGTNINGERFEYYKNFLIVSLKSDYNTNSQYREAVKHFLAFSNATLENVHDGGGYTVDTFRITSQVKFNNLNSDAKRYLKWFRKSGFFMFVDFSIPIYPATNFESNNIKNYL